MILIKSFLISVLIVEGFVCSYCDIKSNKIPNHMVIAGLICAVVGNIVYFIFGDVDLLWRYAVNLVSATLIAFVMYVLHIWAGGDVKLFVLMSMLIPADFLGQKAPVSIVTIYITVFSVAFIYLIIETIILTIRKRKKEKITLKFSLKTMLICMVTVNAVQTVFRFIFQGWYYEFAPVFLLANIFLILAFHKIKFLRHPITVAINSCISICGLVTSIMDGHYDFDFKSLALTAAIVCFRMFAEQFNYQEINTVDVKKGMILSYATVLSFSNSRVKGLPKTTTEDIGSRITQEEADSIIRWATSKTGKDTIVILKKIPFAIFIFIGFFVYIILGVFVW